MPAVAVKSIDRKRLYTDPVYRFDYLAAFSDFKMEDIDAIHASAGAVAPLVPTILDLVYQKLFSFDLTKQVFLKRNEGFTGDIAKSLETMSLEDDQIKMRKDFLGKYLVKLVTGKYDAEFIKYLDLVGKVHTVHSKRAAKINVEYIHISALFAYVSTVIIGALMDAGLDKETEKKTVLAFNKLLWIQNDFFAKWYVVEAQEFMKSA